MTSYLYRTPQPSGASGSPGRSSSLPAGGQDAGMSPAAPSGSHAASDRLTPDGAPRHGTDWGQHFIQQQIRIAEQRDAAARAERSEG